MSADNILTSLKPILKENMMIWSHHHLCISICINATVNNGFKSSTTVINIDKIQAMFRLARIYTQPHTQFHAERDTQRPENTLIFHTCMPTDSSTATHCLRNWTRGTLTLQWRCCYKDSLEQRGFHQHDQPQSHKKHTCSTQHYTRSQAPVLSLT